jgi:L-Ala-D/L-Glu epimerase
VITVSLGQNARTGRGEGVPYPRYNETVQASLSALERNKSKIEIGVTRNDLSSLDIPMSARNALDCALWDLEAKTSDSPVWKRAGLPDLKAVTTAYTISLDEPEAMAQAAAKASHYPLLKLKLGGDDDTARIRSVRAAVPKSRLIIDANEGWSEASIIGLLRVCASEGVELIEQPLPAASDQILRDVNHTVPICADESAHDIAGLAGLVGKYDAVNIKLDKTGGLTPAIAMANRAKDLNLKIMIGCMVSTSLSMLPALHLAHLADWVDLDGPLILARDRENGLRYEAGIIFPPSRALWG